MGSVLKRVLIVSVGLVLSALTTATILGIVATLHEMPLNEMGRWPKFGLLASIVAALVFLLSQTPMTLPVVIAFALLSEGLRWRSLFVHGGMGVAMGVFLFGLGAGTIDAALMSQLPDTMIGPFVMSGLAGAVVYWVIAGRGAGRG